ncbi:MAG: hypothetical protein IJC84_03760 [Clostridia bacterium]|nr:hypothetical protein [Clostridia bacterium]
MTINEKVAYLRGLMEGLDFQTDTKEGKIIKLMADILEDMSEELLETQDSVDDINEYLEAMDEDLTTVEEALFDEYDDEDDDCCCDCDDCDDDCDCEDCGCDEECYQVTCPHCKKTVCFELAPESNVVVCPCCGGNIPLE